MRAWRSAEPAGRAVLWATDVETPLPGGRWQGQVHCEVPTAEASAALAAQLHARVEVAGDSVVISLAQGDGQHKLYAVLDHGAAFSAQGPVRGPVQRIMLEAQGVFEGRAQPGRVPARLALVRLLDGRRLQSCDLTAYCVGLP